MPAETAPRTPAPEAATAPLNPDRPLATVPAGIAGRLANFADNMANRRTVGQVGGDVISSGVEASRQLAANIGEKVTTGATGAAMHTERAISSIKERGLQGKEAVRGFFSDKKAAAQERVAERIRLYKHRGNIVEAAAKATYEGGKEAVAKKLPSKETLKAVGAVVISPVVAAALVPAAAGYVAYRGVKAAGEVAGKGKEAAKAAHAQHKENAEVRKTKRADAKVAYKQAGEAVKKTNQARKNRIKDLGAEQKADRQKRKDDYKQTKIDAKQAKHGDRQAAKQQRLKEANERMARQEAMIAAEKRAKIQRKADKAMGKSVKHAERSAYHEDRLRSLNQPETPSQVEVDSTQELRQQQAERDKFEDRVISNFKAHGATDEQLEAYRETNERMKEAELGRGRLFISQYAYKSFEALNNPDHKLEMGLDSGFEQGQTVRVQRSSGKVESQWTFLGVDEHGQAEVARFDDETDGRLYKSIPVDGLKQLNQQQEQAA